MVMDGTPKVEDDTSQPPVETSYNEEQVAEIKRKATSDALADAGRARKEADRSAKIAEGAIKRLDKMARAAEDAEREANKDNPIALNAIDERRKRTEAETKLEEAEDKLREAEELKEVLSKQEVANKLQTNAQDIAARLGVDATLLAKLATLTDGSVSAIEAEANELPKVSEPRQTLVTDSGKGSGVGKITIDAIAKMSPDAYAKNREQIWEQVRNRQI